MIRSKCATAVATFALMGALSACAEEFSVDGPTATSSSTSSAQGGEGEGQPATSTFAPSSRNSPSVGADEDSCSGLTAQEALDKWISEVPPHDRAKTNDAFEWDQEVQRENDYDECADLSWINIGITRPTASSPEQVMLFHRGEFVMTATEKPEQIVPTTQRNSDGEIEMGFRFQKPGEVFAASSGRATSTYKWDENRSTIVRSGDLPDGNTSDAEVVDGDGSTGTASCAGGFQPPDGVEETVCEESVDGTKQLTSGQSGAALIFTPSRNIWCSLREDQLDCSMTTPKKRVNLGTSGKAYTPDRDDGPVSEEPTTVHYGQSVTYGPFACTSQAIGLSCWNTETQHGLFLSKEESHLW